MTYTSAVALLCEVRPSTDQQLKILGSKLDSARQGQELRRSIFRNLRYLRLEGSNMPFERNQGSLECGSLVLTEKFGPSPFDTLPKLIVNSQNRHAHETAHSLQNLPKLPPKKNRSTPVIPRKMAEGCVCFLQTFFGKSV